MELREGIQYFIIGFILLNLSIYGYLMIINPAKKPTLHEKHQYAMGGLIIFYFYLPAAVYSYMRKIF